MVRRSAQHLLVAGALSMGALLPGCQWPAWPGSQSATACRRCELPCSWLSCCGFSRCIDDKLAQHAAYWDAQRALHSVPECLSSKTDYADGFIKAFQDVAIGHRGDVPALPPERYWNGCFRTGPNGQRAQDWFAGYCDGAEHARLCYGPNEVPVSAQGYPPAMTQPAHGMHATHVPPSPYGIGGGQIPGATCPACEGGRR